jgi:hypothetical protein
VRLMGQAQLGFYAAQPVAVAAICKHLALKPKPEPAEPEEGAEPPPKPVEGDELDRPYSIIDPCAGEGAALRQIAEHLGIEPRDTYAVELDAGRAELVRQAIPRGRLLGPCSFFGTRISANSFGLAYVNPPFDDQLGGGGRDEQRFAERATRLLKPGGILALVLPYRAIKNNRSFQVFLDGHYDEAALMEFPAEARPYNEVVYFGKRRRVEATDSAYRGYLGSLGMAWTDRLELVAGCEGYVWDVPWSKPPMTFKKSALTEVELIAYLAASPLNRHLGPPPRRDVLRPPADLSIGHVALMLASGMLNGTIRPPAEPPHVVRGTARKVEFQSVPPTASTDEDTGVTTIKEVRSEKIDMIVRAVAQDGEIFTFADGGLDENEDDEA